MKKSRANKLPLMNRTHEFIVSSGVEGPSLYLDGYRIAGPKPWGGGHTLHRFVVETEDMNYALRMYAVENP